MNLRSELSHAVTRFDRKQEMKRFHNRYALAQYLMACDRAMESMATGERLIDALYSQFNGALLLHLINWFSDDQRRASAARRMPKRASFTCALCGQRIDDGKPCGCGARH